MANRLPRIELTGADGLIDLLRTLPAKRLLPEISKGMRAVGSKTMRAARSYLRKGHGLDTGYLRKSLGVRKVKTYKKEGRVVMFLGPRRGFRGLTSAHRMHDPFYIAHLVEFGHRIAGSGAAPAGASGYQLYLRGNKRKKNVFYTFAVAGYVQPKPFLRPAVDANKSEFNKQMAEKIRSVLSKAKAKKTP